MKVILVLLDGLGDRTYPELGHKTPLAAADTPNLDRLSEKGSNGIFHAIAPGRCLPSETAHFLMFGYDWADFPGRGLFEAIGENVEFDDADILVLAHLSKAGFFEDNVLKLECGRDEVTGDRRDLRPIYQRLTPYEYDGISFNLHHTGRNDAILVVSGDVSPDISDSDPILRGMPVGRVDALAETREPKRAAKTAEAMNQYLTWCHYRLKHMPPVNNSSIQANFLLTQRSGRRIIQEPFSAKWGFSPALIATGGVYKGIAKELGFDFIKSVDTAHPGKDLSDRIRTALDDKTHDFIHVHTKVPDDVSHKGDPLAKTAAIGALDSGFAGLIDALENNSGLLAVITADHSTPSRSALIHSGETVPVVIAGGAIRKDPIDRFDEIAAISGSLGLLRGSELMHVILNCSDKAVLEGIRLGRNKKPYLDDTYPPFLVSGSKNRPEQ
ncbi:MAG: alkaline phosphatase family protein [Desulfosalsimonas sp.]